MKTADLCRKHEISDASFYNWKAKYDGLTVPDAARLRALEDENRRLKKLLAESRLDVSALTRRAAKRTICWEKPDPVWSWLRCGGETDGRPRLLRASPMQADRG